MKKILMAVAVAFVAATSQAANINWSVGGKASTVVNDYQGSAYAGTAYLVLATDLSGITDKADEAVFTAGLSAITLDTASATSDGKKPTVAEKPVSSSLMTADSPTTLGMLIWSKDADGNGWYKVVTAPATPYADGASAANQTMVTTSWASLNQSSWTKAWTSTSVPEPATGALALAGLALLFRRRRA